MPSDRPSRVHHFVLKALFDIKFEGPLRQGMDLNDQVVALILFRLLGVVCLDEIEFERLAQNYYDVLNESVHLDDQLHHVLRVLLVRLDLVQLLKVVGVRLEGEHLEQAALSLVHDLVDPHHLGLSLALLMVDRLHLLDHAPLDRNVNLLAHQLHEAVHTALLFIDQLQIALDPIVQVLHHRLILVIHASLHLVNRVLRSLIRDHLIVTPDDGEMVVELRVEVLILLRKLLNARLHIVAQLHNFVFRRQQVEEFLHFGERRLFRLRFYLLLERPQTSFALSVVVAQLEEILLELIDHRRHLFLVFDTVALLAVSLVLLVHELLHLLQVARQLHFRD